MLSWELDTTGIDLPSLFGSSARVNRLDVEPRNTRAAPPVDVPLASYSDREVKPHPLWDETDNEESLCEWSHG